MKIALEITAIILMMVLILMSSYLIVYPGVKEVVWLVPNDESCSDIWLDKDFDGVIRGYELREVE